MSDLETKQKPWITDEPAGAHGDDELTESERNANEFGPPFVNNLFSASKTLQVHNPSNRASQRALSDVMLPLKSLLDSEGRVNLRVSTDYLLINDVRVTVDQQGFGPFLYMIEEMKKREVEGIEILPKIDSAELGNFLQVFFKTMPEADIFESVTASLAEAGVENVKLTEWVERERLFKDEDRNDVRQESNQVFFRTVLLMGEVVRGIEQRRAIQVRKAERLTQQMVDIIQTDESILVGLASIKSFDEYTFAHSVNVCVLSMLMGDRLRLYKSDIARLGVAALLHDIGKTYVPQNILNKPDKLTDQDWELMKYHTFFGVKELSRVKSLGEVSDALFVALQHHVHYNNDGYPQRPGGWDLPLFTRIVTVADYFDAMTTPRVYSREPLTPNKALCFIFQKSGEIFDPFIAKVFLRAMGMYPIGTVVELDTGEKGVVVRQNDASRFIHRPVVALLDKDNTIDPTTNHVDLAEGSGGQFERSVAKAIYDEAVEIKKGSCFTSELSSPES